MTFKCCVLSVLLSMFLAATTNATTYFLDDFEDGDAEDGSPVTWVAVPGFDSGNREVIDGDYVVTPGTQPVIVNDYYEDDSIADGVLLGDVSVRTKVRALDTGNSRGFFVSVLARHTSSTGVWGAIRRNGELNIGTYDEITDEDNRWRTNSSLNPLQMDINLQLDVIGDTARLTAWADGQQRPTVPQVVAFLPSYVAGEGEVGVWVGNFSNSTIRNPGYYSWFVAAPTTLGSDFDLDADVDGDDLLMWQMGFGQSDGNTHIGHGDADGNGAVNGIDFLNWQRDFDGGASDDLLVASSTIIPEPTTWMLIAVGFGASHLRVNRNGTRTGRNH